MLVKSPIMLLHATKPNYAALSLLKNIPIMPKVPSLMDTKYKPKAVPARKI